MSERGWRRAGVPRWLAGGLLAGWLLAAGPAAANDYGIFIDIETEEELLDLLAAQEIDENDYETLVELLHDGVDLNSAGREELYALPNLTYAEVDAILAYRDEVGRIADPVALVTADVLSQRKLLAIAPFIIVEDAEPPLYATKGRLQYNTTYVAGDEQVPSMWLLGELSTFRHLDVGLVGVLTRNRLANVVYDPSRDALSARRPDAQFHLPKFYLEWETKSLHAVVGTYRIGFGQRLTFDNTTWYTPNGIKPDHTITYNQGLTRLCKESAGDFGDSPCAGARGSEYQSPDYRWTDRFRGAAVGLKKLELGGGWLQAYGWFSHQTRSIYQYEIYDRDRCADPRNDDDEACKAPDVFVRRDDLLAPTTEFSYHTLPNMFNELLGGGNVTYFFSRRAHIGVTGYGADISWLVKGMDLDFQEWAAIPYGGPFGAVGLDFAWGVDLIDIYAEVSRSFDSQPAGGGWAALLRATTTWPDHEFEAVARYYDKDFANPYSRPVAAPDEYDGRRGRDEAGLRLRYSGEVGDLRLRATQDIWAQLSDEAPKLRLNLRADYDLTRWFHPGVWVEFQDRDLAGGGRYETCFETPFLTAADEPVPCDGEKAQVGVKGRFLPTRELTVTAKLQHRWLDDGSNRYDDAMRQDSAAWLVLMYKPIEGLRLRARMRYLFEAIEHDDYREHSLWTYLEAAYWVERIFRVKLRYEVFAWLDDRDSTRERNPNPAHWLRLELEYRF